MPVPPMQVQVIENQADIAGTIREIRPHDKLANYSTVVFDVKSVDAVDSYPNLMASTKGLSIDITVPNDEVARRTLAAGQKITLRVKKAGPGEVFLVPRKPE